MKLKDVCFYRAREPVVEGEGPFRSQDTVDLLRYDVAFVDPADPTLVAFPRFKTQTGLLGGVPTHDRWRSFGVRLEPATFASSLDEYTLKESFAGSRSAWVTYRHPRDAEGRPDYGALVPVSVGAFLEPSRKDTHDL